MDNLFVNKERKKKTDEHTSNVLRRKRKITRTIVFMSNRKRNACHDTGKETESELVSEWIDGSKESWRWGKALSGLPSCCAVVTCVTHSHGGVELSNWCRRCSWSPALYPGRFPTLPEFVESVDASFFPFSPSLQPPPAPAPAPCPV